MGTFDVLSPGDRFSTPSRAIEPSDASALVSIGGYTHPLFTDPAFAKESPFGRPPLPGEAVLLLMGGLAERSGRFDETTVALTGFDEVRFVAPAFAGDELRVEVEVLSKERSGSGRRGTLVMAWRCANQRRETVVEAIARMLFRTEA
jgi:acyl dehydratase